MNYITGSNGMIGTRFKELSMGMGYKIVSYRNDVPDNLFETHEKSSLIHSESTTPFEEIDKCSTIGISSGASAPEILVNNFINNLKEKYDVEIEEVEIIKENIIFKIPKKLN